MKPFHWLFCGVLLVLACALGLGGCSNPAEPVEHEPSVFKKAVDRGSDIEVASNINQINQMLSMVKSDNDGKAPATIEEAKRAAKLPAEMWLDSVSGLPLEYDPKSGTVYRKGANPNTPSMAGAGGHRLNLPEGSGGF